MRIWVSRPEPGAARTARRLAGLGHRPLIAPVLRVGATGAPPPPGPFGALLLTSANAVEVLGGALRAVMPAGGPVLAVGARTAEHARAAGLGPVLSAEGDGAALAALARARLPAGTVLLHAAGEDRKPEPGASLAAAGYPVAVWTAYAARPLDRLPAEASAALEGGAEPLAAALHYSRRSAEAALALCRAAGREGAFRALAHYCLSADVAVPLVGAGIAVHFVAARPNEDSLLAGIEPAN